MGGPGEVLRLTSGSVALETRDRSTLAGQRARNDGNDLSESVRFSICNCRGESCARAFLSLIWETFVGLKTNVNAHTIGVTNSA